MVLEVGIRYGIGCLRAVVSTLLHILWCDTHCYKVLVAAVQIFVVNLHLSRTLSSLLRIGPIVPSILSILSVSP